MNTYPYLGDRQLEPDDNSIEEARMQAQADIAFDEYLEDGYLPGNLDTSDVDERMLEEIPEALDALITAKNDGELLAMVKRIREVRIRVIKRLIADNIEKSGRSNLWKKAIEKINEI